MLPKIDYNVTQEVGLGENMDYTISDGRTRRGLANRQSILTAAMKIFQEKAYADITMRDISQEAGVGYGTLYTHFNGKEDILMHLIDEFSNEFNRFLYMPQQVQSVQEVEQRIAEEIIYLLKLAQKHQAILIVAYQAMGKSDSIQVYWYNIFQKYIDKAVKDYSDSFKKGITKASLNPGVVAKSIVYLIKDFFWDVVLEREDDLETISKDLAALYVNGAYRQTQ